MSIGGFGAGGAVTTFTPTPKTPFIPRRACPETEHRNATLPLRGKATVIVCDCPGRSNRVPFRFARTKSWVVVPRLRTTNFTVEPAGTDVRERANEKSRASTRMVIVRVGVGAAAAETATTAMPAAKTPMSRAAPATRAGYCRRAARWDRPYRLLRGGRGPESASPIPTPRGSRARPVVS